MRAAPFLLIVTLLVAACAQVGDTFDVTPFLREQITGDTRRACLGREYQVQTRFVLRDGRDWLEASRFSAKGWAALRGESVHHWSPGDVGLGAGELYPAQRDLETALVEAHGGACACAKTEAAYDGVLAAVARVAGNQEQVNKNFSDAMAACRQKK